MTSKPKKRGLSPRFMDALKTGVLKPILDLVRNDNTLDLQIRDDYINIYYRGGSLLRVQKSGSGFEGEFDLVKYMRIQKKIKLERQEDRKKRRSAEKFRVRFSTLGEVSLWMERVPHDKFLMDRYITNHPHEEREAQQWIVRENNYGSLAKSTDYFICDIEFAQSAESFQFDMIAAHWPSTGRSRKNTKDIGLAFIEVKYGDGALAGTAGIDKHLKDMKAFLSKRGSLRSVASQMKKVFNQKIELGLISDINKKIDSFGTKPPEYIFIFGNHDPQKSKLVSILDGIDETSLPFNLRFAVSNFMGFGLYDQCVYSLEEFRDRFEKGIYSK